MVIISSQFPRSGWWLKKSFAEDEECLIYHNMRSEIVFHKTAKKKGVMQLSANNMQLLSSNFTSCHLSTVKMVFPWNFFAIFHSNWPDTSLGIRQKNLIIFHRRKFVTSFFDIWFDTLLTTRRYKKYAWNTFKRRIKFWLNLTRPFYWYKTLHLRHCTLAIVRCLISWSFLFVFLVVSLFLFSEGITS